MISIRCSGCLILALAVAACSSDSPQPAMMAVNRPVYKVLWDYQPGLMSQRYLSPVQAYEQTLGAEPESSQANVVSQPPMEWNYQPGYPPKSFGQPQQ